MKKISIHCLLLLLCSYVAEAQVTGLKTIVQNPATSVKNQGRSGTCWDYSGTSLVESEALRKNLGDYDLSEMYTARCVYLEKAKNYLLRQGKTQFGEGGLGHDLIHAIAKYGAIPKEAFPHGDTIPNHAGLDSTLKAYLDHLIANPPVPADWIKGYTAIIDQRIGVPPASFTWHGKTYTPQSFAKDVLRFDEDDYVSITSFTDHPYYQRFILETPDNFANGSFYNIPLQEMIDLAQSALKKHYTLLWDADVSNSDFQQRQGFAMLFADTSAANADPIDPSSKERSYTADMRQELYENLTTEDDHLMHMTGLTSDSSGKVFFTVKNSWGNVGPFNGYIEVSVPYFAINTISIVVPKAALPESLKKKWK